MKYIFFSLLAVLLVTAACGTAMPAHPQVDRLSTIPTDVVKGTPENDLYPPHASEGWSQPVPLEGPINTSGAEDGSFLTADGQTFYFFFTPDTRIPVEQQVGDDVTGLYLSKWTGSGWGEPTRVWLTDSKNPAMDGCEFVLGDEMWFCSIRAGNVNEIDWYIAHLVNGQWADWKNAGEPINGDYQVGELHITPDWQQMFFGSKRPGGYGGVDLWVSQKVGDGWGEPVNLGPAVNTAEDENRPYVTVDGQELWYDSRYSISRCLRQPDGT